MKAWSVTVLATTSIAVWAAAPASADPSSYIDYLQNDTYLVTAQQSTTAG